MYYFFFVVVFYEYYIWCIRTKMYNFTITGFSRIKICSTYINIFFRFYKAYTYNTHAKTFECKIKYIKRIFRYFQLFFHSEFLRFMKDVSLLFRIFFQFLDKRKLNRNCRGKNSKFSKIKQNKKYYVYFQKFLLSL